METVYGNVLLDISSKGDTFNLIDIEDYNIPLMLNETNLLGDICRNSTIVFPPYKIKDIKNLGLGMVCVVVNKSISTVEFCVNNCILIPNYSFKQFQRDVLAHIEKNCKSKLQGNTITIEIINDKDKQFILNDFYDYLLLYSYVDNKLNKYNRLLNNIKEEYVFSGLTFNHGGVFKEGVELLATEVPDNLLDVAYSMVTQSNDIFKQNKKILENLLCSNYNNIWRMQQCKDIAAVDYDFYSYKIMQIKVKILKELDNKVSANDLNDILFLDEKTRDYLKNKNRYVDINNLKKRKSFLDILDRSIMKTILDIHYFICMSGNSLRYKYQKELASILVFN